MATLAATGALLGCSGAQTARHASDRDPTACFQPHLAIAFDLTRATSVLTHRFSSQTAGEAFLIFYRPGPWPGSYYFVMAPDPNPTTAAASRNVGILPNPGRGEPIRCVILGGGSLPDARGRELAYNYFAEDRDGNGRMDVFTAEDLDLDEDRRIDLASRMVLVDTDGDLILDEGFYETAEGTAPIPKEGENFMLRKPLWNYPVPFPNDELKRMNLFQALSDAVQALPE